MQTWFTKSLLLFRLISDNLSLIPRIGVRREVEVRSLGSRRVQVEPDMDLLDLQSGEVEE